MPRVFVPPEAVSHETILINDAGTVRHLMRVLRLRAGDRLECCDGTGRVYVGTVTRVAERALHVAVERQRTEAPPQPPVTLAQALIKPDRFEWMLEKATELGVARILPLITARTTIRHPSAVGSARVARWRRILEAASAQCVRSIVPSLETPQRFEDVVTSLQATCALLPTLAEESPPLNHYLPEVSAATHVDLLIGPEGDFTPEELRLAKQHGVRTTWLGRSTLRSETAALAVLTLIQHAAGRLS